MAVSRSFLAALVWCIVKALRCFNRHIANQEACNSIEKIDLRQMNAQQIDRGMKDIIITTAMIGLIKP
nr:MAG: hypothetical protein EDM05_29115 [Leptolyngbya sp. IPPAS B-1204]